MLTLSKIAKLAHVSVSTVSKAFSMSSEVNEQTRELIFNIAKEHNCFKKFYNAKYPKFVIAVICPEFKSRDYSSMLSLIQKYLSEYNCEICVASTEFCAETEKNLLEYYTKYSAVDGIIMIGTQTNLDTDVTIPIAAMSSDIKKEGIIRVKKNTEEALTEVVDYFISKDVKDIGFVGEERTMHKLRMLKNVMNKRNIELNPDFVSISEERFEGGGYKAMNEMLKTGKYPRAIVCGYDCMAIGAMRCIFDHGLKIPQDIAVMGMGDNRETSFLKPSLSSMNLNNDEVCRLITEAIINKITDKPYASEITVCHKVNFRESTRLD